MMVEKLGGFEDLESTVCRFLRKFNDKSRSEHGLLLRPTFKYIQKRLLKITLFTCVLSVVGG